MYYLNVEFFVRKKIWVGCIIIFFFVLFGFRKDVGKNRVKRVGIIGMRKVRREICLMVIKDYLFSREIFIEYLLSLFIVKY